MKLPREVKIWIGVDGRVEVQTYGFVGESCVDLSKALEQALVGEFPDEDGRVSRQLLPEFYLHEQAQEADAEDHSS